MIINHKILADKGVLKIDFILVKKINENEYTNVLIDSNHQIFDENEFIGVWNVTNDRFKGIKEFRLNKCTNCNIQFYTTKSKNYCRKCEKDI